MTKAILFGILVIPACRQAGEFVCDLALPIFLKLSILLFFQTLSQKSSRLSPHLQR
jgi:hypothetical protein